MVLKTILHEQMMEILQVEVVGYQISMVGPSQPTVRWAYIQITKAKSILILPPLNQDPFGEILLIFI